MPDQNYMSHRSENCFVKRSYQQSIREVLGVDLCNSNDAVKHYKKSEHKWNKELKYLKNKNKILFSIGMNSGLWCKLKKINSIKAKYSKKRSYSISNISISDSDYDSSLSSDSDLEEKIHPTECKEINKLYHVVTDNIKKNKNHHNDAIENEPNFDNKFIFSSSTKDPLPVVTVSLRGVN